MEEQEEEELQEEEEEQEEEEQEEEEETQEEEGDEEEDEEDEEEEGREHVWPRHSSTSPCQGSTQRSRRRRSQPGSGQPPQRPSPVSLRLLSWRSRRRKSMPSARWRFGPLRMLSVLLYPSIMPLACLQVCQKCFEYMCRTVLGESRFASSKMRAPSGRSGWR